MVQEGRDAGEQDDGRQANRERARTTPCDQHGDGDSEKQCGEFHPPPRGNEPEAAYDSFADVGSNDLLPTFSGDIA
jgi:hypothetical protein